MNEFKSIIIETLQEVIAAKQFCIDYFNCLEDPEFSLNHGSTIFDETLYFMGQKKIAEMNLEFYNNDNLKPDFDFDFIEALKTVIRTNLVEGYTIVPFNACIFIQRAKKAICAFNLLKSIKPEYELYSIRYLVNNF